MAIEIREYVGKNNIRTVNEAKQSNLQKAPKNITGKKKNTSTAKKK